MENPLVSVICLCYNQARFIEEALNAVASQAYANIELIVVDDASTDDSQSIIENWLQGHPDVLFIRNEENEGSTKSFNKALAKAEGKYIIDLAGDDILLKGRIESQVQFFEQQAGKVGVIYSDAQYINEFGYLLDVHFKRPNMIPHAGDIYCKLIDTYFIPTPTMMIRTEVLDELKGYDENLYYEDFDFWIRSSRNWNYAYQPEISTYIRLVSGSQSSGYGDKDNPAMNTTLEVCKKIHKLNRTPDEHRALINRLKYEIRQAFLAGKKSELLGFYRFWGEIDQIHPLYLIIKCIGYLGLKFNWLRELIRR